LKFLDKLIKKEATLQRLFGIGPNQFRLLVKRTRSLWKKSERNRLERSNRSRAIGGGHPYKLESIEEKVAAVLLYYKQYPTQELLGLMIGIDQSAVSRLLKRMLPLLEQAADAEMKLYLEQLKENIQREPINNIMEFFSRYPDLKDVSTDATEQQCYRSHDYATQKEYYSGKSKQHTIKTQISVSRTGRILDVSKSYPGSVHDKAIIDKEKTIQKFDKRVPQRFDSGYQGLHNSNPDHYIIIPIKKTKNKELTALGKQHNQVNSRYRVIAEHAFSRLKKFRILSGVFRQEFELYNQIFRNIAAICNFKLLYPIVIM